MAVKVVFDVSNKLIIVKSGITSLDVRVDLLSDIKEDWQSGALDINLVRLNKIRIPFRAIGGDATSSGEIAPLYLYLTDGWRIRPQEANGLLDIISGAILVDEDTDIDPFVNTLGAFNVRVRMYVPIRATILSTGVSGLTAEESTAILDLQIDVDFIKNMEKGEWKVENDQMVQYDTNSVEIARYDLFGGDGLPTMVNVFRRVPV